jgi:hypothetical protein
MSDETINVTQDELTTLKQRADMLNVSYHPSIGVEKLREKVAAAIAGKPAETAPAPVVAQPGEESELQRLQRLRREANELVRIRLTCMNPNKKEWEGEIFSVGNAVVGTLKKFVPFNTDDGWHVPRMIYEQLLERQCQVFVTLKSKSGTSIKVGKLIKEFAIEVLPPLSLDELKDLAQQQAMAKSID